MNILQIRNAIHYYEQQKNITNDIYMYILVGSVWWYTYPSLTYEFVNGKDHIPYMEKKSSIPPTSIYSHRKGSIPY